MPNAPTHAVTGAFGYSGKYIAQRLLAEGRRVITLTNSTDRANAFGGRLAVHPFNFDQPDDLARSLEGVDVLYNTYWVRFNHKRFTHADAVRNTLALFEAARRAGVRRVVHVSITNPSEDSPLEYFSGKARLERALAESGLSYAILRPTVLFGKEDILINNIAWVLRHLPVFGVFGDGRYKLQPVYVDDLAALAVAWGGAAEDRIINAIGPETFTYRELVRDDRPADRRAAAGDRRAAGRGLLGRPGGRRTAGRRDHHPRGDRRADGEPAVRGDAAHRRDEAHRLDRRACGHAGPALHQRAGPPRGPRGGVSKQLRGLPRWPVHASACNTRSAVSSGLRLGRLPKPDVHRRRAGLPKSIR